MSQKIVVGITGASGVIYGIRALQMLRELDDVETHLVVSNAGYLNVSIETDLSRDDLHGLADIVHSDRDVGATIASGSYSVSAMLVAPCSMRSLAAIASGLSGSLLTRAADVTLKERRRLVLVPREAPLNLAHLRNMTDVTQMGGIIFPPVPAFYTAFDSVAEMVDQTVARILQLAGIETGFLRAWQGLRGD